ncbi:MAG: hypothetical protein WBQ94_06435 [Terracidiphilus sp.]
MPGYRGGVGYVAPGYGWVAPYFPWYPGDIGYDSGSDYDSGSGYGDSATAQNPGTDGYDALPPYPGPPEPAGNYPPVAASPIPSSVSSGPPSEEEVTLVFKDGRPPVQIHDYLLTRNTLYVWDRPQKVIPTDQLDLVATAKANQDAGVDFQLPESPK